MEKQKFKTLKPVVIGTEVVPAGKVIELAPGKSADALISTGHVAALKAAPAKQAEGGENK
jgi:hypothetical protein